MSWCKPDIDCVAALMWPQEKSILDSKVPDWQQRAEKFLASATDEMRGAYDSCRQNDMHPNEQFVPKAALNHIGAMVLCRLLSIIPKGGGYSEKRKDLQQAARRFMDKVCACGILAPDPDGDETASSEICVTDRECRVTGRKEMKGL